VIVAAGLDSRPYRLEWATGTTVFEVDQPKVLKFKARVLAERGAEPAADRKAVAADLRGDWSIPLKAGGFDPGRPTAWSAEGLLPYLTAAAQDALFARIDQLSAAGSQIAIGALGSQCDREQIAALETSDPEANISGAIDFSALTYDDHDRADPAGWLAAHGWAIRDVSSNPQLQARYGRTPADVDLRVDRVLRSQYVTAVRSARGDLHQDDPRYGLDLELRVGGCRVKPSEVPPSFCSVSPWAQWPFAEDRARNRRTEIPILRLARRRSPIGPQPCLVLSGPVPYRTVMAVDSSARRRQPTHPS